MTEVQPRPKFIDEQVRAADKALVKAIVNAPLKRGWNRTFGVPVLSQSDHIRKYNGILKSLNELCNSRNWEPIFAEEREVKPVSHNVKGEQS